MAEKMYRKSVQIEPRSQRANINLIVYLSEHGKYGALLLLLLFIYFKHFFEIDQKNLFKHFIFSVFLKVLKTN